VVFSHAKKTMARVAGFQLTAELASLGTILCEPRVFHGA
jgi:hypothetical protein